MVGSQSSVTVRASKLTLVERIMSICKQHLSFPGSSREMAAKLTGRLLSRPDTGAALLDFLTWCDCAAVTDEQAATFLEPGEFGLNASDYLCRIKLHGDAYFRLYSNFKSTLKDIAGFRKEFCRDFGVLKMPMMSEDCHFCNVGILHSLCEIVGSCGQSVILSILPQLWSKVLQLQQAGNRSTSAR